MGGVVRAARLFEIQRGALRVGLAAGSAVLFGCPLSHEVVFDHHTPYEDDAMRPSPVLDADLPEDAMAVDAEAGPVSLDASVADASDANVDDDAMDGASDARADGGAVATSCARLLASEPGLADGTYDIDLDGDGPLPSEELYCDMQGGGWTLVANQLPNEVLDDSRATVNPMALGRTDASYRLGAEEMTKIAPDVAWKLTDDGNAVYFAPTCVVDWNVNYADISDATECTVGYADSSFTGDPVNGGFHYVSARGIGINHWASYCSIRMYEAGTQSDGSSVGSLPAGRATPCSYYGESEQVSLWFR